MSSNKFTPHKLCQFIVKKYIKDNVNWAREIKIAKGLIKTYQGYSFWNSLKQLKLPSLAWFLTDEGKAFLAIEQKKNDLSLDKNIDNIILTENKAGEDKKVCQKPKSLLEFISYGKKI
jgi:hypothetical protein